MLIRPFHEIFIVNKDISKYIVPGAGHTAVLYNDKKENQIFLMKLLGTLQKLVHLKHKTL
jgi:hypothetical protein